MTNEYNSHGLDPLDVRIIEELESEGKQTHMHIATKLNVSRQTLISRMQRLINSGVIRKFCWVNPIPLGYKYNLVLFIYTEANRVSSVVDKLVSYSKVLTVYLCTGRCDIAVWGLFRDNEEIADFVLNELGSIEGIVHVEKMVILREAKTALRSLPDENKTISLSTTENVDLDNTDINLIEELQENARQKTGQLARKLGVSNATILRRMQRLVNNDVIRIVNMVDPFVLGYVGVATIGLKCHQEKIEDIASTIASYKEAQYVAISVGRYDIVTWVVFQKLSDLRRFIVKLGNIPGVKDIETMIHYKLAKLSIRFPAK